MLSSVIDEVLHYHEYRLDELNVMCLDNLREAGALRDHEAKQLARLAVRHDAFIENQDE